MKPDIHSYIRPGAHAHLVGIGGVSMSPLAEVLHNAGVVISGSDLHESAAVSHLRSLGIPVVIGHRGESVQGAGCVIRTAAAMSTLCAWPAPTVRPPPPLCVPISSWPPSGIPR